MRSLLCLIAPVAIIAACGGPPPPKGPQPDPACAKPESLSPGSRLAASTDSATPKFALRVRGPGELALAGFVNPHEVTVYDLGTGAVASHTVVGCTAKWVKLPTEAGGFGDYCVVIEPKKPKAYSTFDLGFTTEPHPPLTADQEADAAKLCQ
jgi:hypothetical protein